MCQTMMWKRSETAIDEHAYQGATSSLSLAPSPLLLLDRTKLKGLYLKKTKKNMPAHYIFVELNNHSKARAAAKEITPGMSI